MDVAPGTLKDFEAIVVGSGAGGATAAWELARLGLRVALLEEGGRTGNYQASAYSGIKNLFRDFGTQAARTRDSIFPLMQGRALGGTTVINGAIMNPLSESVYEEWAASRPGMRAAMPFHELDRLSEELRPVLRLKSNHENLADSFPAPKNLKRFALNVEAMPRTAPACVGTGRCLQGCPSGAKLSLDRTLIADFEKMGGTVFSGLKVHRLVHTAGRITALELIETATSRRSLQAVTGQVVLAGGAIQTPLLLFRSYLNKIRPGVGRDFQCHLSASVVGIMPGPAFAHDGPPQGWQATTEHPRLKLSSQLVPPELIFARFPVFGTELRELMAVADRASCWTPSVRSSAVGRIRPARFFGNSARIDFDPTEEDLHLLKQGISTLSCFLFAGGAQKVFHGVAGLKPAFTRVEDTAALPPLEVTPKDFTLGAGHLFGGACFGESKTSVVGYDLRFHGLCNLFIADASVLPGNTGSNPQWTIMTIGRWAATKVREAVL